MHRQILKRCMVGRALEVADPWCGAVWPKTFPKLFSSISSRMPSIWLTFGDRYLSYPPSEYLHICNTSKTFTTEKYRYFCYWYWKSSKNFRCFLRRRKTSYFQCNGQKQTLLVFASRWFPSFSRQDRRQRVGSVAKS